MRFGILGTGRITRRLVADLQSTPGVQVTAIASRDVDRADWYAQQYGIATGVEGYQALLGRDDVDAVYIALPPSMHCQWAVAAAEHGKHVLCEKPLAISAEEAHRVDAVCQEKQVRWLDATGWLHHPRTANFSGLEQRGKLGTLKHLSSAVSFYEPFQSGDHRLDASLGGGCVLDLGWYAVGLPIWFAGRPLSVYATAVMRHGVPYRMTAMMWFPDDVTATINCGYDVTTRKWFEVAGDSGSIVCDDFTRPWPEREARFWSHDRTGAAESHAFEGNQEQAMLLRFTKPESDLAIYQQQALDTQQTLEAITQSLQNGQRCDVVFRERETPAFSSASLVPAKPTVWFLSGDLMFGSRIRAAAEAAGLEFRMSSGLPTGTVGSEAADEPSDAGNQTSAENRLLDPVWMILDLSTRGGMLSNLDADSRNRFPHATWLAYGPHVQVSKLKAAREAGIELVLTRSQFDMRLPTLFK